MKKTRNTVGSFIGVWSRIIGFVLQTAIHVFSG